MLSRVITSVLGLPIIIAIVFFGGIPLRLLILLLSIVGMLEFYKAVSKNYKSIHFIGIISAMIYVFMDLYQFHYNIFTAMLIILLLLFTVAFHKKYNIIDAAITLSGFYYICFLLYFIYLIKIHDYGKFYIGLIFISAWGCDTGAYLVGITLGKHKLTPSLSPNKTVEGSIGGVLSAVILAFVYSLIIYKYYTINIIIYCCIITFVASIFSQLGDLTASAIKRYTGIKDFGYIVPGHGGVLDRFDSILFTAPVVYCLMILFLNIDLG